VSFSIATLIALAACMFLVSRRRTDGLLAFFAMLPFGAAAAINLPAVGNASIIMSDLVAMVMIGLVLTNARYAYAVIDAMRVGRPAFYLGLALLVALLVTIFAPRLLQGTMEVFGISRNSLIRGVTLVDLGPSSGNITQSIRLILGVLTFLSVVALFSRPLPDGLVVRGFAVATTVNIALGAADFLTYTVRAPELLSFIRNANYAILFDHVNTGLKRIIGGYPEASAYGYFTMGLFGFWLGYWVSGGRHRFGGLFVVLCLVAILLSGSSGTYVSMFALLGMVAVVLCMSVDWQRIPMRTVYTLLGTLALMPVVLCLFFLLMQTNDDFATYFNRLLFDKLDSQSGVERGSWNSHAFGNFLQSGLMGVGLGSLRTSSSAVALLSNIGIVGTIFYALFLAGLLFFPTPRQARPETSAIIVGCRTACIGLLLASLVTKATPDLELPFYLYAGLLLAHRQLADRQGVEAKSFAYPSGAFASAAR
jgi:hypothetical protein